MPLGTAAYSCQLACQPAAVPPQLATVGPALERINAAAAAMPDTLKITNIETHVLLVPDVNPEAMSSSQDEFRASVPASACQLGTLAACLLPHALTPLRSLAQSWRSPRPRRMGARSSGWARATPTPGSCASASTPSARTSSASASSRCCSARTRWRSSASGRRCTRGRT